MHVAFRVDASTTIGTGHFMRCFTLANQLLKQDTVITFICRHWLPAMVDMLEQNGISFKPLLPAYPSNISDDNIYADWLGTSQLLDAEDTITALLGAKVDWLIIDHYALDHTWESKLRPYTGKIMVIDDIANRKHDCDLLLDQNFYLDMNRRYDDKVPGFCRILLGPRYALLSPQFLEVRNCMQARDIKVERVLVFFGGVDAEDYTSKAITALTRVSDRTFEVDVVIGNQHPNKSKIIDDCSRLGYFCHVQTDRMASLIADADIAIGAGGSATWERCALGLPTLAIPVAENQRRITADAATIGLVYSPEMGVNIAEAIYTHLLELVKNKDLLLTLSINGMKHVDANGVSRVIQGMNIK